jgi:hypothetical protein
VRRAFQGAYIVILHDNEPRVAVIEHRSLAEPDEIRNVERLRKVDEDWAWEQASRAWKRILNRTKNDVDNWSDM